VVAHIGAFTWGLLDNLLEGEWLHFEDLSGTSAGAMNAVARRRRHGLWWTRRGLDVLFQTFRERVKNLPRPRTPVIPEHRLPEKAAE
jgi:NTE family protein